jgi:hypothetical protein
VIGPADGPEALREHTISFQQELPIVTMDMKEQMASGLLLEAHFSENRSNIQPIFWQDDRSPTKKLSAPGIHGSLFVF